MRILVTGATGFIGSYVVRNLLKNPENQVFATHRRSSSFDLVEDIKEKVVWKEADVLDLPRLEDAISAVDYVIHAAAMVSMDSRQVRLMEQVNIEGVTNVVNLCISHQIKRLIHLSSVTALGFPKNELIDESSSWQSRPFNSEYARTKYLGELEVFRSIAEGLKAVIVNPPFVMGASHWYKGPNSIVSEIYRGLSFYPKGSSGIVDVRDLSKFIEIILFNEELDGQKVICSASNIEHKELFAHIANKLQKPVPRKQLSPILGIMARTFDRMSSLFTGGERLITKEGITIANMPFKYDNSKSLNIPNFEYREIEKTIDEVCKVFLSSIEAGRDYGILNI